jgi:signal transduction histidine kinase
MFAAGFVLAAGLIAAGHDLIFRLWGSYTRGTECFWRRGSVTCHRPLSSSTHLWFLVGLAAAVLLAAWAWWLVAGRTLRPLSQTVQAVRQLGPDNLRQRIRMTGSSDVLKELADALDDALDRLSAGYEGQRRFAANASHELRTPLAVQRLLTEVAMDDPQAGEDLHRLGTQLIRVNERNERLIEGLLVLAESDRGVPGGWVEVEVAGEAESGPALSVRNTGQDVPAEAVAALFEPFRRLSADRTNHSGGAGLGMSIARSITAAHGGTIRARPRSEGGLIVDIELPVRN